MRIEWLIAFYIFVCIAMMAFDFLFVCHERAHERRLKRKQRTLAQRIRTLLHHDAPDEKQLRALERSLKTLDGLEALDLVLERLQRANPRRLARCQELVAPALERLSHWHAGKSPLRDAYFAYIVGRWYVRRPANHGLIEALLTAVRTQPLFVRENALMALSTIASAHDLADAIAKLEDARTFHHPKLLTEALLAFPGDREELAEELTRRFDELHPDAQAAVINFGRMADITYHEEAHRTGRRERLLALMTGPDTDLEVRLACIRFFTRDPWEQASESLRSFAEHDEAGSWECAAVAASALAHYPGSETVATLKRCLTSPVWHVRHNAARSLHDLGLSLDEMSDVIEGPDRFARDTVRYHWREEA